MRTRRQLYGLRIFVPGLRERHRLEAMVGPLGYWHALQKYHFKLLRERGLKPEHTLLDIGCGPLQAGIPLIRFLRPGGYVGLDIDPSRISVAESQIAKHRLTSKRPWVFQSSTLGDAELGERRFDYMWASQILCYFRDAEMNQLFSMLKHRLNPGGRLLGDTFAPDHYEFTNPERPGDYVRHTIESLSAQAETHGLLVRSLGRIGDYGYPKRLTLHSNPLYEITVSKRGTKQPLNRRMAEMQLVGER